MDPYGIDQNQIITDLVKDFSVSVFDKATNITSAQIKKLKTTFKIGFDSYLSQTIADASMVKTILYRDKSENIGNIYVEQNFSCNGEVSEEYSLREDIYNSKSIIVLGSAGSGKSFFVKNLVYRAAIQKERFPIFVELRHVERDSPSILQHIVTSIFIQKLPGFDKEDLDYALKSGLFFLVLDGLDEVTFEDKARFLKEIEFIQKRYAKLSLVVTSRPDTELESLPNFPVYRVLPLAKESALKLIDAIQFDELVKQQFIQTLDDNLYDDHREFASNPLLLTMLLITFDQVGEIPDKMHIFYSQAFEALVFKHDLMKSRYIRPQRAGLEINKLRKAYAHFCASTYLAGQISFSEADLLDKLERSLLYVNAEASASDLAHDLISCFSMLKRDGLRITFVHRSFQEYFCAFHISNSTMEHKKNIIARLASSQKGEQSFGLLADMNPELVSEIWALPLVDDELSECERVLNDGDYARLFREYFRYFILSKSTQDYDLKSGFARKWKELETLGNWLNQCSSGASISPLPEFHGLKIDIHVMKQITSTVGMSNDILDLKIQPESHDNAWISNTKFPSYVKQLHNWILNIQPVAQELSIPLDDLSKVIFEPGRDNFKQTYKSFRSTRWVIMPDGKGRLVENRTSRKIFE